MCPAKVLHLVIEYQTSMLCSTARPDQETLLLMGDNADVLCIKPQSFLYHLLQYHTIGGVFAGLSQTS